MGRLLPAVLPYLILNDCYALAMAFCQYIVQQGSLARAKKPSDDLWVQSMSIRLPLLYFSAEVFLVVHTDPAKNGAQCDH